MYVCILIYLFSDKMLSLVFWLWGLMFRIVKGRVIFKMLSTPHIWDEKHQFKLFTFQEARVKEGWLLWVVGFFLGLLWVFGGVRPHTSCLALYRNCRCLFTRDFVFLPPSKELTRNGLVTGIEIEDVLFWNNYVWVRYTVRSPSVCSQQWAGSENKQRQCCPKGVFQKATAFSWDSPPPP